MFHLDTNEKKWKNLDKIWKSVVGHLSLQYIALILYQGHPTSKLAQNPLRDISRFLVMFKDYLKSCFDQLEKIDLFGFLS